MDGHLCPEPIRLGTPVASPYWGNQVSLQQPFFIEDVRIAASGSVEFLASGQWYYSHELLHYDHYKNNIAPKLKD